MTGNAEKSDCTFRRASDPNASEIRCHILQISFSQACQDRLGIDTLKSIIEAQKTVWFKKCKKPRHFTIDARFFLTDSEPQKYRIITIPEVQMQLTSISSEWHRFQPFIPTANHATQRDRRWSKKKKKTANDGNPYAKGRRQKRALLGNAEELRRV